MRKINESPVKAKAQYQFNFDSSSKSIIESNKAKSIMHETEESNVFGSNNLMLLNLSPRSNIQPFKKDLKKVVFDSSNALSLIVP